MGDARSIAQDKKRLRAHKAAQALFERFGLSTAFASVMVWHGARGHITLHLLVEPISMWRVTDVPDRFDGFPVIVGKRMPGVPHVLLPNPSPNPSSKET